jgi:hypothetical protein
MAAVQHSSGDAKHHPITLLRRAGTTRQLKFMDPGSAAHHAATAARCAASGARIPAFRYAQSRPGTLTPQSPLVSRSVVRDNDAEEPMAFDKRRNGSESLSDSYGEFGEGLQPSPTNAAIALAIMIVVGVVLYQVSGKSTDTNSSSAPPAISRDVANNNR